MQPHVSDKGGQGHGEGQEQDANRMGGTADAQADRVQTRVVGARLEATAKTWRSQVGSAL